MDFEVLRGIGQLWVPDWGWGTLGEAMEFRTRVSQR